MMARHAENRARLPVLRLETDLTMAELEERRSPSSLFT